MIKAFTSWAKRDMAQRSAKTDTMYDPVVFRSIRTGALLMRVAGGVMIAWATWTMLGNFGLDWPGMRGEGLYPFMLPVHIAVALFLLAIFRAERHAAVFRLSPLRSDVPELDEWEVAMRRRVAERTLRGFVGWFVLGMVAATLAYIMLQGGAKHAPRLSVTGLWMLMIGTIVLLVSKLHAEIAACTAAAD